MRKKKLKTSMTKKSLFSWSNSKKKIWRRKYPLGLCLFCGRVLIWVVLIYVFLVKNIFFNRERFLDNPNKFFILKNWVINNNFWNIVLNISTIDIWSKIPLWTTFSIFYQPTYNIYLWVSVYTQVCARENEREQERKRER